MLEPGDIVFTRGQHFAVVEVTRTTPSGLPDALISDGEITLQVHASGLAAIGSATFEPGQKVRFQFGRRGVVVRDLGDTIEVTDERDESPIDSKRVYITPVPRGPLTAVNLAAIVKTLGE